VSFETLETPEKLRKLFFEQFSDVVHLIPDFEGVFFKNPTGNMVTVKCDPWNYKGQALLLGDAAHAIVPFFGQGMNCGFEDCTVLDKFLEDQGRGMADIFHKLFQERKVNADAIADLAVENFIEMRDKVGSANFLMEKGVEQILMEKFPGEYISRYSLVSFSRQRYRFAYEMGLIQNEILSELCAPIQKPQEVDLKHAGVLIRQKLSPLIRKERVEHGS
jgi:kynurenine 3-monooxygenase